MLNLEQTIQIVFKKLKKNNGELNLNNNGADDQIFGQMMNLIKEKCHGLLEEMRVLSLVRNKLGNESAMQISIGPFKNLTTLRLTDNRIGDKGVRYLANSFEKLTYISLNQNEIGDQGTKHIGNGFFANLKQLYLSSNKITNKGVQHLVSGPFKNLREIYLFQNRIKNQGVLLLLSRGFQSLKYTLLSKQIYYSYLNDVFSQTKYRINNFELKDQNGSAIVIIL